MIAALLLALALGGCGPRCEPYAERCDGGVVYSCGADGRWRRGVDCARTRAVCEVEPGGVAVCVSGGGARPFP